MSFLILVPGSARAEGEARIAEETSSDILEYTKTEGGISITGFKKGCKAESLVIPAKIDGLPVVAIADKDGLFSSLWTDWLSIESVSIPSTVKTIGKYAFAGCTSLTSVTFADNSQLTSIGDGAFTACFDLTSVTFADNSQLTSLGKQAFAGCTSLTSVTFADDGQLTSLGDSAFYQTEIKSIEIPASLTTLGEHIFEGCTSLTSVTFADNSQLTSIAGRAFKDTQITRIEIPSSVKTIEDGAFEGCTSLTSVTFADNSQLTSIGSAFARSGITSIEIPSSVTTIKASAFYGCSDFTSVTFADNCQLTSIGCFSFSGIKSIKIPSSVTTIESAAFRGCSYLSSVTFADNCQLTSIGDCAFYQSGITSIRIPSSVKTIDRSAFYDCGSLRFVTFADNSQLTSIGDYAFENTSICDLVIPSSVTTIGYKAFANGGGARHSITFADNSNLTSIGDGAFQNNSNVESIEIPSSVTSIGKEAFADCVNLTSVIFNRMPKGDVSISDYDANMFSSSNKLKSINVPKGYKEIYKAQFGSSANLVQGEDIVADGLRYAYNLTVDGLICIGVSDEQQKRITIPAKVEEYPVVEIAAEAFQNNTDLEYVMVSDVAAYDKFKSQTFFGSDKLVVRPEGTQNLSDKDGVVTTGRPTLYEVGKWQYQRTLENSGGYATLCLPFALNLGNTPDIFEKVYVPMNTLIHNIKESNSRVDRLILMLKELKSDAIIPAGQPIFVKLSKSTSQISLSNYADELLAADLPPKTEAMTVVDWDGTSGLMTQNDQLHISYQGTLQPQEATETAGLWTFNSNGTFGPNIIGTDVLPFRLALSVKKDGDAGSGSENTDSEGETPSSSAAKQLSISIGVSDGTTTSIHEIISSDALGSNAYGSSQPGGSPAHAGIIYDLGGRKVATAASLSMKKLRKGIYILDGKKIVMK